jgi:hypothetical protein
MTTYEFFSLCDALFPDAGNNVADPGSEIRCLFELILVCRFGKFFGAPGSGPSIYCIFKDLGTGKKM